MAFRESPNVHVGRDEEGRVRVLRHPRERFSAERARLTDPSPRELADAYLGDVVAMYDVTEDQTVELSGPIQREPVEEGPRLKFDQAKTVLDTVVVAYQQTVLGLPIWQAALQVRMYGDPPQVASSDSTLHHDVRVEPLTPDERGRYADQASVREALGLDGAAAEGLRVNDTRWLVYRYDPKDRLDPTASVGDRKDAPGGVPTLPLPPLPDDIEPGRHYIVREVLFTLPLPDWGDLNWRTFIEPRTGSVLYLRALVASATACVFPTDPVTASGNAFTGCTTAAALDPLRTTVTLLGLDAPNAGVQALRGNFVDIRDTDPPSVAPPTTTTPFSFCYSAITDDFTAANAYYHYDGAYRLMEAMGFDVGSYFDGTTFPVPVDHQGEGTAVNAHAIGNAAGNGMEKFTNGLAASGCPVGIAADRRVPLHEFGHALLWDHVGSPNFGFCHSAGDTLGVILSDAGSLAPDRFVTFPFVNIGRRHDRDVAAGWAWGGTQDDTQYGSEQILSTLLFRVYRSTGGDDAVRAVQEFAARYLAFLIIKAIGTLTVTTTNPEVFATAMMDADESTVSFEGHPGGAWHKVLRWSFEEQGLYQPPGAPTPVAQPGAPPAVDVYIDDGRAGTYAPYLPDFSTTADIWNRQLPDAGTAHEQPLADFPNYVYVRVRNRGTQSAPDVAVKLFEADPASGLNWPGAWTPAATAQLAAAGPILPGGQMVLGPFVWTPQSAGVACLLASSSATGDPSNADTVNGPLPHWRLVPFDNNLAQRNVAVDVADPCEQMGHLADYIATLNLPQGLTQSLTAKLRNAKRQCERGHPTPACNMLNAFDNQVTAQTGNGLTTAQAGVLRGHSDGIKTALGC
jgi:zinc metalloprotease ZmpB